MTIYFARRAPITIRGRIAYDSAASNVQFNCGDIDPETGVARKIPIGLVVRSIIRIITPFNAGTTNTLVFGRAGATDLHDDFGTSAEIDATIAGFHESFEWRSSATRKATAPVISSAIDLMGKYTQSGTAASAGEAEIWLSVMET